VIRVSYTGVVANWFPLDAGSDRAERFLRALEEGDRIAVPSSFFFELAHVLWCHRRTGMSEKSAAAIWNDVERLPLLVTHWEEIFPQALSFAYRFEISPYDAAFVVLARELGCELITADRRLWKRTQGDCPWVQIL
jgi:predicted nucleic acid-binding protein